VSEDPSSAAQSKVLRNLYLTLYLRGRTSRGLKDRGPRSVAGKLWLTLMFYAAAGCFSLFMLDQPVFSVSLYLHGAAMFFIGMFVASSAGEILFNKEEAEILLHRPVSPRAMLWTKVRVLCQVSLWLVLAFNLAPLVAACFGGWTGLIFVPAHVISVWLSALFCTGSVVLIYQLCLRWFGRERLDGLMTFSQVMMTMLLVLGGQIIPHLLRYIPEEIRLTADTWWLAVLPPAWFAGLDELLMGGGAPGSWVLATVGLVVTGTTLVLAFGKLAASYGSGLRTLGESSVKPSGAGGRPRLLHGVASLPPFAWWLRDPLERAGFLLVGAYMLRDREMKLRLYPGVAPLAVLPILFLFIAAGSGAEGGGGPMLMLLGTYVVLLPMTAMGLLRFSQNWQAADVFLITPTHGPGPLLNGARKAVDLFLTLPAVLVQTLVAFLILGDLRGLYFLLPGIIALPAYSRIGGFAMKGAPLSEPAEESRSAKRGLIVFFASLSVFALGGLAAGAQALGCFLPFLLVEAVAGVAVCLALDKRTRGLRWKSVDAGEAVPPRSLV
jgi:ABC-2 type transport system permease protein